jgi:hypothetical protein
MPNGISLTHAEINAAYDAESLCDRYLPVMSPRLLAEMFGLSRDTIYAWLEEGKLAGTHRRRGKHQLIWRDRARLLMLNGKARPDGHPFRAQGSGLGLTDDEILAAFRSEAMARRFPPVLSPEQFGHLIGVSRAAIYLWNTKGWLDGATTRRGGRRFIWRNRAIALLFNGPEWRQIDD